MWHTELSDVIRSYMTSYGVIWRHSELFDVILSYVTSDCFRNSLLTSFTMRRHTELCDVILSFVTSMAVWRHTELCDVNGRVTSYWALWRHTELELTEMRYAMYCIVRQELTYWIKMWKSPDVRYPIIFHVTEWSTRRFTMGNCLVPAAGYSKRCAGLCSHFNLTMEAEWRNYGRIGFRTDWLLLRDAALWFSETIAFQLVRKPYTLGETNKESRKWAVPLDHCVS